MTLQHDQSEDFRLQGHLLIDYLADYLKSCNSSTLPVTTPIPPDSSYNYWENILSNNSLPLQELFRDIVSKSIHLHHPGYVGHQVATSHPSGILADLIASTLNNGMAVYEMGQVSIAMEKAICAMLTNAIGWGADATGFFTSGGTLANLTALLSARQIYSKSKYWYEGHATSKYAVMVSTEAHYCIERAVKIMGLGNEGIIHIPINTDFKIDISQLENIYQSSSNKGLEIFAFVANAGSTATGSYDDIEAIAKFCKEKKIWLHVDGAHGGAVLLSAKHNHLIKGIDQADSMTLDFHKLLQTPILCTTLLYRNEENSYETFSQGAKYLYQDQSHEWYQLGKRTFECTKPMMVLKAFTLMQQLGKERLARDIEDRYDLAKEFAESIKADPDFELATNPESNIVCFKILFDQSDIKSANQYTQEIRREINASGSFYLVQTQIKDTVYLRCSLMNVATNMETLSSLLDEIRECKKKYKI